MCLAKGLTGGYLPLAVTLAKEEIFAAFLTENKADALLHGHSFTANPLGCAAAIASIEFIQPRVHQRTHKRYCMQHRFWAQSISDLPSAKNPRSIGTVMALELNVAQDQGYASHATDNISRFCFEQGLFIRPLGNTIYFMPPLIATKPEVLWALSVIKEAILRWAG